MQREWNTIPVYFLILDVHFQKNVPFSIACFILLIKSSMSMQPNSPPNLDLTVTVCVSTSFGPTTAINGIFSFSEVLISFGRRSPLHTSLRIPWPFSLLFTSLQNSSCKSYAVTNQHAISQESDKLLLITTIF